MLHKQIALLLILLMICKLVASLPEWLTQWHLPTFHVPPFLGAEFIKRFPLALWIKFSVAFDDKHGMINYKLFFRWIVQILNHSLCFYSSYYPAGSKRALEERIWFWLHHCKFRKRQWSQKCDFFEIRSVEKRSETALLPEKKQAPKWSEVSASRWLFFWFCKEHIC